MLFILPLRIHHCLIAFGLAVSSLAWGQERSHVAMEEAAIGSQQETTVTVLCSAVRNGYALGWNEDGFVKLTGIQRFDFLVDDFCLVEVRGTLADTTPIPVLEVEHVIQLSKSGPRPPIRACPSLTQGQPEHVVRTRVVGTVRQVIDLEYIMILNLDVDGTTVQYSLRKNRGAHSLRPVAGQFVSATGVLWDHFQQPSTVAQMFSEDDTDLVIINDAEADSPFEPFEAGQSLTNKTQVISSTLFAGFSSEDLAIFIDVNSDESILVDLDQIQMKRAPLESKFMYRLRGKLTRVAPRRLSLEPVEIFRTRVADVQPMVRLSRDSVKTGIRIGSHVTVRAEVQAISFYSPRHVTIMAKTVEASPVPIRLTNAEHALLGLDIQRLDKIEFTGVLAGDNHGLHHIRGTMDTNIKLLDPIRFGRNLIYAMAVLVGLGIFGILWIVTLRRSVRDRTAELSRSKANLAAVYSSVPEGILAADSSGTVFITNPLFESWFPTSSMLVGNPEQEALRLLADHIEQPAKWLAFIQSPEEQDSRGLQVRTKGEGAVPHVLEIRALPIRHDHIHSGRIWLFRDITQSKKFEESLVQSSKLEAIGRLTGGIAHDFNNLLTGVVGNLSILELDVQSDDLRDLVRQASSSALRASELVHQLLDYAKQTRLDLQACSVNDILIDLHDLVRHGMDARCLFLFDLAENLKLTEIDPLKIEQVLMNLLINATDAMPHGGTVTVTTQNLPNPEPEKFDSETVVCVRVSDTGIGMSEEVRAQIFEPFFSTKGESGNGLGLSTAQGIVEKHGGSLLCSSVLGEGTRFELLLPATTKEPSEPSVLDETDSQSPSELLCSGYETKPVVMVIDDEPIVRTLIRSILQRHDCDVLCFPHGQEAVEYLTRNNGGVDLIISDNSMPILDGVGTYRHVRKFFPETPFIVVSGYLVELNDYANAANGIVPDAFIQKPLSVKSLVAEVKRILSTVRT